MPFIMAVKGRTKADILAAFERAARTTTRTPRRATALAEIDRIAALRLEDILRDGDADPSRPSREFRRRSRRSQAKRRAGFVEDGAVLIEDGRHRGGRRGARHPRPARRMRPSTTTRTRLSCRADRRPHPLPADAGDRLLWRAIARLAAHLHLRRGAAVRRSRAIARRSRNSFSRSSFATARRRRLSTARSIRNLPRPSSSRPSAGTRA